MRIIHDFFSSKVIVTGSILTLSWVATTALSADASLNAGNLVIFDKEEPQVSFNRATDLLLANFDCKTDVDDLHSVAAVATILRHPDFRDISYYAVAGAYGVQEGLYVPPNKLFAAAFGKQWSDAHSDPGKALLEVYIQVSATLAAGGDIWIPEAGQSDFTAALLKQVRNQNPGLDTRERFHVVQHSNWNEEVTTPASLEYVRQHSDYHKIPDGNTVGNGSPGFRTDSPVAWKEYIKDSYLLALWEGALDLANHYNGAEGRYLNASVQAGGFDFSDVSETCYILGLQGIPNAEAFFRMFAQ